MADFDSYAPKLRKLEGGWVDDPDDPGGATMQGVTLTTFRRYYGADRTKEQLRNITYDQWKTVMRHYWMYCKGNHIVNQSVAEIFCDAYVNGGATAIRAIQRALNVPADGAVGPVTYGRINALDTKTAFYTIKDARLKYYQALVNAKPTLRKFIHGWYNRVNSFTYVKESDNGIL